MAKAKKAVKQIVSVDINEVGFVIDPALLDLEGKDNYLNCLAIMSDPRNIDRLEKLIDLFNFTPSKIEGLKELNKTVNDRIIADITRFFKLQNDILKYSVAIDVIGLCKSNKIPIVKRFCDNIGLELYNFELLNQISEFFQKKDYDNLFLLCTMNDTPITHYLLKTLEPLDKVRRIYMEHLSFDVLYKVKWDKRNKTGDYRPAEEHVTNFQFAKYLNLLLLSIIYESKITFKKKVLYLDSEPIINLNLSGIVYDDKIKSFTGNNKPVTGVYPNATLGYAEFVKNILERDIKVLTFFEFDTKFYSRDKAIVIHYFEFGDIKELIHDGTDSVSFYYVKSNHTNSTYDTAYYVLTPAQKPQKDLTFRLMKKVQPARVIKTNSKKNKK